MRLRDLGGLVVIALLVDLVLMRHGGAHKVTFKEATWWSIGWVLLALAFNLVGDALREEMDPTQKGRG